jgi:hypothetical protein
MNPHAAIPEAPADDASVWSLLDAVITLLIVVLVQQTMLQPTQQLAHEHLVTANPAAATTREPPAHTASLVWDGSAATLHFDGAATDEPGLSAQLAAIPDGAVLGYEIDATAPYGEARRFVELLAQAGVVVSERRAHPHALRDR